MSVPKIEIKSIDRELILIAFGFLEENVSSISGKGAGSLIGGFMIKAIGTRPTYQVFATACAGFSVIYFLFHNYYTMKRPKRRMNDIIKPNDPEIQLDKVTDEKKKATEADATPNIIDEKKQSGSEYDAGVNHAFENDEVEKKNKENEVRSE